MRAIERREIVADDLIISVVLDNDKQMTRFYRERLFYEFYIQKNISISEIR